jgi:hypothetical protein
LSGTTALLKREEARMKTCRAKLTAIEDSTSGKVQAVVLEINKVMRRVPYCAGHKHHHYPPKTVAYLFTPMVFAPKKCYKHMFTLFCLMSLTLVVSFAYSI